MSYTIKIIDRETREVIQEETRKSLSAADKVWFKAMDNINQLKYKMVFLDNGDTLKATGRAKIAT